eukprot:COSAG05_NODE_33_length_28089_cov_31.909289_8_plen_45_part_00
MYSTIKLSQARVGTRIGAFWLESYVYFRTAPWYLTLSNQSQPNG